MHVIPTGSSVLVQELLPEARSGSASASAIESTGANVLHSQGTPAQVPNPSGPASQAMQLTLLLGEQYMLVNTIGEQQLFAVRLQEQHQQNLAKLMQDLSQESNAIHYKAQIDRAPVQPEAIYALQQRAQTAEERLRYEYAQLANTNAQEIALLEAKIDPVIKDIMVRDGAAYALSFINQRLQDLRAQIASEGTQQDPSTGRDNNGANTQHTDSYASEAEAPDANATAGTESAPMADIDDVQENLERISVSSTKKGSARGAPSAKKAASKTKEGKLATKEQTKHKGSSTQQQDESISAADAHSVPEVHAHSETVGMSEMSPGVPSSKKDSGSVLASDKEKNKIKTAVVSSNSISESAAPWSTSTSTAPKKPKKTLLQIQKEEEEAMMKRQLADEKKRAQALLANPIMATAGMGSSYAGRLGNSSSAGSGSSGLSTAVGGGPGGSSRYSLAAIMEEQSKELSKDSPGLGSGTLGSNSPTASTSVASRIAAAASLPSSQGPPVFSWTTTGGSSTASSSLSAIGTSSNAINSTAVKKQQQKQSTKPTTTTTTARTWGGVQKQQDSSASKLPSMEFLEWCYSRLTSLRGIDICKFIEVLLTFPPQVPESALEIISEQIYAYSQSLNGHAFAEDFAKRRRKDYASVRGGSTKSAPENWAQVLKSQPAGTSRLSAGSGASGYVGRIRFILVQNRQGKTRLEKWYGNYSEQERNKLKAEVHRTVASRDQKHQSNFVEFHNHRIIYRRYAGLFFCFCVDTNDNELACLEAIHLFVEILDSYHGNVCELDLVFNFYM
ncbi:AP-2 complex subunit sigma, partial [Coemansia sp. RSA 2559]